MPVRGVDDGVSERLATQADQELSNELLLEISTATQASATSAGTTATNTTNANGFLATIAGAADVASSVIKTAIDAVTAMAQAVRDRLPAALVGGRLDTIIGAALPVGTNSIGAVTQGAGSGTAAGFWTVQVSNGSAMIPFPTALVGGRFDVILGSWLGSTAPTVGQKTAANSIPVILASDNGISVYMPTWPAGQLSPPGNQIPWVMTGAGGRPTGGQNWVPFATDTSGNQYSLVAGNNPTPDATTRVYTILLGTSGPAAITGAVVGKASAGRVKRYVLKYTGGSATTYVQIHKAATTGAAATSTLLEPGMPVGTGSPTLVFEPSIDLPCASGIVIAFSSTQDTYTADGAQTGTITLYGA
jgi:hypothetical protein